MEKKRISNQMVWPVYEPEGGQRMGTRTTIQLFSILIAWQTKICEDQREVLLWYVHPKHLQAITRQRVPH